MVWSVFITVTENQSRTGPQLYFCISGYFFICIFNTQGRSFSFETVVLLCTGTILAYLRSTDVHHKTHPSFAESMVLLRAVDGIVSKPGLGRYLEAGAFGQKWGCMQTRQPRQQNVCKNKQANKEIP